MRANDFIVAVERIESVLFGERVADSEGDNRSGTVLQLLADAPIGELRGVVREAQFAPSDRRPVRAVDPANVGARAVLKVLWASQRRTDSQRGRKEADSESGR